MTAASAWLSAAAAASLLAAVAHLCVIAGGPAWYRALGAGERLARAAAEGERWPALVTVAIAGVLAIWAAYALSGAGLIARLPLLRPALVAITAIYLARGCVLFSPALLRRPDLPTTFLTRSSAIVLTIGITHAIGLWQRWPSLTGDL